MADSSPRTSYTEITVRSWTLDLYGQVSNSKFLEFLEEARWNHFEGFFESGMFLDLGLAFVLVNVNLNYSAPAHLGDVLDVVTWIERVGSKSITLAHKVVKRGSQEEILDGSVTFVVKDLKKGSAVVLTGRMRDMFLREDEGDTYWPQGRKKF
jgi:thioesterase-3